MTIDARSGNGGLSAEAVATRCAGYAFANVAEELRRQYTIGFYPKRTPQVGQRRMIRVRARQPNLAVRARDSYIFNPSGSTSVVDNSPRNVPVLR